MDLTELAGLVVVPGLEPAVGALSRLYQSVELVKVYKNLCIKLCSQCKDLLLSIHDNDGSDNAKVIDAAGILLEQIARKVQTWASWSKPKALLRRLEIKQGIEDLSKDVAQCATRLNVMRKKGESSTVLGGKHVENKGKLQPLLDSTQDMQTILKQPEGTILDNMLSIQEALHAGVAGPEERSSLEQRLLKIHRQTELLPPMIDLTEEVRRIGEYPVKSGGFSDVYLGEWLGNERVALKLTRGINTSKAQKRFINEVAIWRQLQHQNVAKLYGMATLRDHIYTVSPWMERGDALTYIENNPNADRLKILCEGADGLGYLHEHGVVHGDLRGANMLISDAEVACITDFGLSAILEEVDASTPSSLDFSLGSPRWMAPELINPEIIGVQSMKPSTTTDVWSYGMLCLEVLSGQPPFQNRPRDPAVIFDLIQGVHPARPSIEVTNRGLSDALWDLMQQCWDSHPHLRPPMSDILPRMRTFQSERANPRLPHESSYIKYKTDGTVAAATLSGLMERLLHYSPDPRKDMQFKETFLAMYPMFTNLEQVIDLLFKHFDAPPPYVTEKRVNARYAVLTVLDSLLRGRHAQAGDIPLLTRIHAFTISVQGSTSPTFVSFARRLTDLIDAQMTALSLPALNPSTSVSSLQSSTQPSEMTPQTLARALTTLESVRYRKLIPWDCIGWLTGVHDNAISSFNKESSKLSYWVQKSILKPNKASERFENLKYFLGVAEECRKLGNFSSSNALYAGLTSSSITRLKRTCALERSDARTLAGGQTLISNDKNFQAYRKALDACKEPCVPWLYVHLHDVQIIFESQSKYIKQGEYADVINFAHCHRVHEQIRHLLSFQSPLLQPLDGLQSYDAHESVDNQARSLVAENVFKFVDNQLRSLVVNDKFHNRLEERAARLYQEEFVDFNSRKEELMFAGFTRPHRSAKPVFKHDSYKSPRSSVSQESTDAAIEDLPTLALPETILSEHITRYKQSTTETMSRNVLSDHSMSPTLFGTATPSSSAARTLVSDHSMLRKPWGSSTGTPSSSRSPTIDIRTRFPPVGSRLTVINDDSGSELSPLTAPSLGPRHIGSTLWQQTHPPDDDGRLMSIDTNSRDLLHAAPTLAESSSTVTGLLSGTPSGPRASPVLPFLVNSGFIVDTIESLAASADLFSQQCLSLALHCRVLLTSLDFFIKQPDSNGPSLEDFSAVAVLKTDLEAVEEFLQERVDDERAMVRRNWSDVQEQLQSLQARLLAARHHWPRSEEEELTMNDCYQKAKSYDTAAAVGHSSMYDATTALHAPRRELEPSLAIIEHFVVRTSVPGTASIVQAPEFSFLHNASLLVDSIDSLASSAIMFSQQSLELAARCRDELNALNRWVQRPGSNGPATEDFDAAQELVQEFEKIEEFLVDRSEDDYTLIDHHWNALQAEFETMRKSVFARRYYMQAQTTEEWAFAEHLHEEAKTYDKDVVIHITSIPPP